MASVTTNPTQRRRQRQQRIAQFILPWGSLALLLLIWAVGYRYTRFIPPPSEVLAAVPEFVANEDIVANLLASLGRVVVGLSIALVLGTLAALAMAASPRWEAFLGTYVVIGFGIPGLAAALFALMIFGLSNVGVYAAVAVVTFPFVTTSLRAGAGSIDRQLVEMAHAYNYGFWRRHRHITVPTIAPDFVSTARNMHALAWKVAIIAEVFLARDGLGAEFKKAFDLFALEPVVLWLVVFLLTLFGIEYGLLRPLDRFVHRWRALA